MAKKGIDVSAYQGIIDWEKAKKNGVEFAILRAGWGAGATDRTFKRNADECTRLGLPFGVYWFIYATTVEQARQNALACLKTIAGYRFAYPACADLEYDSASYAAKRGVPMTRQLASDMVRAFLDTIRAAGYEVANYTNLDYYKRYFDADVNGKYPLWLAYWGSSTKMTSAAPLWQYSSKGKVAGISGNVDLDMDNRDNTKVTEPVAQATPEEAKKTEVTPAKEYYNIPAVYTLVFDPEWYMATYPDLQQWIKLLIANGSIRNDAGAIAWQLYQHFLICGMEEEARRGNAVFDVRKYKAAQTDLQKAFGDVSLKPYYYHYMQYGAKEIAEGKRAKF